MQRLEVSGAVRPIYVSLGVKRLIKATDITFHVNQSFENRVETCGQTEGRTRRMY